MLLRMSFIAIVRSTFFYNLKKRIGSFLLAVLNDEDPDILSMIDEYVEAKKNDCFVDTVQSMFRLDWSFKNVSVDYFLDPTATLETITSVPGK